MQRELVAECRQLLVARFETNIEIVDFLLNQFSGWDLEDIITIVEKELSRR
jgi:hypothetical protein